MFFKNKYFVDKCVYCEKTGNNIENFKRVESVKFKYRTYQGIIVTILIGIIGPFLAQCILPFFFPEVSIEPLELWNQYVSLILGLVALLMSIVSMYLGFKSSDESYDMERRTRDLFHTVQLELDSIKYDVGVIKESVAAKNNSSVSVSDEGNNPSGGGAQESGTEERDMNTLDDKK